MDKAELVVIVSPLMGHFTQALEMAKLMLCRNHQISFTFLIMKMHIDPEGTNKIHSVTAANSSDRLHFLHLPSPEDHSQWGRDRRSFLVRLVEYQKPHVREIVSTIKGLSGLIVDLLNTTMIDVAEEFGVPSYLFFTSGAAFLGLMLHFQALEDEQNQVLSDLLKGSAELATPCFSNPVPLSVLPTFATNKAYWTDVFLQYARRYRKAKAIMVNSFSELEPHALNSFLSDSSYGKSKLPPIYPIGPIINRFQTGSSKDHSEIMNWLDTQPPSSVVLLCFGSKGSFNGDQVKEIAYGLERSGHRFLWSLRKPSADEGGFPSDYENHGPVLPEGFLDRTVGVGKVVGWVSQLAVLSHSAIGGFVSHCGWNSILESIWCGVPIATWPVHAEQQLNAFQLVKELGLAEEISLDYNEANEHQPMIGAEQIERGIRSVMDSDNEVRTRVKEFSEISRQAMEEGGSSYLSIENFIQIISGNRPLGHRTGKKV